MQFLFVLFCVTAFASALPLQKADEDDAVVDVVVNDEQDAVSVPFGGIVNSLLANLLRQTLYSRMENLLLDPGKKSVEKRRIVESAVENYENQAMATTLKKKTNNEEESKEEISHEEFKKLAGYWIRETPEPTMMASSSSKKPFSSSTSPLEVLSSDVEEESEDVNFQTEKYQITDLFTSTTTTQ